MLRPFIDLRAINSGANMLVRKDDVSEKYGITFDRLAVYEKAGLLTPIPANDHFAYADELRVAVIAKGERLGFTLAEMKALIEHGVP